MTVNASVIRKYAFVVEEFTCVRLSIAANKVGVDKLNCLLLNEFWY